LFLVLGAVLLVNWRGGFVSIALMLSCAASAAMFGGQLLYYHDLAGLQLGHLGALELLRDGGWLVALLGMLGVAGPGRRGARALALPVAAGLLLASQALAIAFPEASTAAYRSLGLATTPRFFGFLLLAVAGLVLVEMLYRNTRPERRWEVKLLCFGVGGLFAYDVYLYAHAVLFNGIVPDIWHVRGLVNAIAVPLIAVSIVRNPDWRAELFVSRHILFHSTAVLLIGAYLLLMAGAGYIIREYGGTWGSALQTAFLFGAVLFLVILMFSTQLRARVKVFLAKHFYRNKYDYREEWLDFTRTLAECEGDRQAIQETIIKTIAGMLDCRWGHLWLRDQSGSYRPEAQWNVGAIEAEEPDGSELVRFMRESGWIIDVEEFRARPEAYEGLDALPQWLERTRSPWLLVPLPQGERLLGFLVLSHSLVHNALGWEDRDLLKTAALQAGAYLALLKATDELAEARQFDAYNRLSAYIVHDLKNVAAQLSLLVANSARHRDNPEFIDDVFNTVASAVERMNRMLVNLRSGKASDERLRPVAVGEIAAAVRENRKLVQPVPEVCGEGADLIVVAEQRRLTKALEHLVTNAQEATPEDGRVVISLSRQGDNAIIVVQDSGTGMDPAFVRNRLFEPFYTTKGNAGMGIGVYEARQIVQEAGGELLVDSELGRGTTFTIRLPLRTAAEEAAPQGEGMPA